MCSAEAAGSLSPAAATVDLADVFRRYGSAWLQTHRVPLRYRKVITFRARSKNKRTGNQPRPFSLPGAEFVRRWSMHILPKGFTKTRSYGGFSCRHLHDYLQRCRQLLQITEPEDGPQSPLPEDELAETTRTCPHCQDEMVCLTSTPRPSWRDLFSDHAACPLWYQPSISLSRRHHSRIRGPDSKASATACTF